MWELDYKESWVPKNWCFLTVVLEKTLENREIKPVHPEGHQSWIFIGRTDAKSEIPILWPPDAKNWCWERLKEEGDNKGWDGWMASLTQWIRVWVNSGSWWWTERHATIHWAQSQTRLSDWTKLIRKHVQGMLQSMSGLMFWITRHFLYHIIY